MCLASTEQHWLWKLVLCMHMALNFFSTWESSLTSLPHSIPQSPYSVDGASQVAPVVKKKKKKKLARHCRRRKRCRLDPWVGKTPLEKEMATHSSILAWEIPWTEEPGRLQSRGLQRVGHDLNDLACTHAHPVDENFKLRVLCPKSHSS